MADSAAGPGFSTPLSAADRRAVRHDAAKNLIIQYGGLPARERRHAVSSRPDVDGQPGRRRGLKLEDFVGILKLAGL